MRTLGIVPARAGSKRVPGKNIRLLGGVPLVARALQACVGARRLSRIVVSSDDDRVLEIARGFNEVEPLRRPAALATDTALAIEYVRHALEFFRTEKHEIFDAVVIVQPSSPFTRAADIDATIELLEQETGADSCVTVMEVDHAQHPAKLKRLSGNQLLPLYEDEAGRMAAHELPRVYVRNCAVYATRVRTIEAGSILGNDSRAVVMPRERSLDINDELDFAFAEFLESRQR